MKIKISDQVSTSAQNTLATLTSELDLFIQGAAYDGASPQKMAEAFTNAQQRINSMFFALMVDTSSEERGAFANAIVQLNARG